MSKKTDEVLKILKEQGSAIAPGIPQDVIKRILKIEEKVQFDGKRADAPHKINKVIQAELDKAYLEGSENGNDS